MRKAESQILESLTAKSALYPPDRSVHIDLVVGPHGRPKMLTRLSLFCSLIVDHEFEWLLATEVV